MDSNDWFEYLRGKVIYSPTLKCRNTITVFLYHQRDWPLASSISIILAINAEGELRKKIGRNQLKVFYLRYAFQRYSHTNCCPRLDFKLVLSVKIQTLTSSWNGFYFPGEGVTLCICPPGPARDVEPMRSRSICRAACLPSEMAVTIKDWPRWQSRTNKIKLIRGIPSLSVMKVCAYYCLQSPSSFGSALVKSTSA